MPDPQDKATFDQFHTALLYQAERERLGIKLDDAEARELLRDNVRSVSYYSTWIPDHTPSKKRRKRVRGPHRGRRTIVGWVMFFVVLIGCAYAAKFAADGFRASEEQGIGRVIFAVADWVVTNVGVLMGSFS